MQSHDDALIFVVEDNITYNRLIVSYLSLNGFRRIESFLSGEECLKNLYKNPDIVIQDYHMDGINGIEVLKESKKRNSEIEFVFLSGDDSYELAANTLKYGAFDYLVKDKFAFKYLIEIINKIMRIHQNRHSKKHLKMGVPFFVTCSLVLLTLLGLPIIFPGIYNF